MNEDKDILFKVNRRDGLTVPDGYFEDFATRMAAALPRRDEAENPGGVIIPPPTLWTRVRPYVYLAAMFAGVWCMLKMFTIMSGTADGNAIVDSNPVLAEAFGSDEFFNEFVIDDINQWDLVDEMIDDGLDTDSLIFANDSDLTEPNLIDPATHNNIFAE